MSTSYGWKRGRVVRASRPLGLDPINARGAAPRRGDRGPEEGAVRLRGDRRVRARRGVGGVVPAYEEPRMTMESAFGRQTMNTMRFLQTGTWTGSLMLDGREIEGDAGPVRGLARPVVGDAPDRRARGRQADDGDERLLLELLRRAVREELDRLHVPGGGPVAGRSRRASACTRTAGSSSSAVPRTPCGSSPRRAW